ncbi:MAG TPA: DNA repair protein RadC [Candidatus Omnitrophota bacterium]|nr:DNA repair protein RadC [Candidatus Omnitrophota bacterium]
MGRKLSVKDWPESEQPVVRVREKGIEALSDAELLSLILKKSTYERTEVDVALELLKKAGGLRKIFDLEDLNETERFQLLAVREIGKRVLKQGMIGQNFVRSPQAVTDYLTVSLRDLKREVFKVLFLDKALKILGDKDLFFGTVDEAAVHPREIVRESLLQNASNLVLVHNHPSGKTEPSREDFEITQKIKAACQTVSIRILDHIIIGENQYFSFSEHNQL